MGKPKVKLDAEKRLEILRLVKAIDEKRAEVETAKDELRELIDDINGICETVEDGVEDIEVGLGYLRSGIEEMSVYI